MKTVWKFPLPSIERHPVDIEFPPGEVIHVGRDPQGEWCAWIAIHDTDGRKLKRRAYMVGTGHPLPDEPLMYASTIHEGPFVWHFFIGIAS